MKYFIMCLLLLGFLPQNYAFAFFFQIKIIHTRRALDVQFMDSGTVATVKVSELKEIPPQFLREVIAIPPQV